MQTLTPIQDDLLKWLEARRGIARYKEVLQRGFHPSHLSSLVKSGQVEKMSRGVYYLVNSPKLVRPDWLMAAIKSPKGVFCLNSALAIHEIPGASQDTLEIALPKGSYESQWDSPAVRYFHFAEGAWKAGVENYDMEGRPIQVYSLPKTVADCFKFRSRVGTALARRALGIALRERSVSEREILYYAKICRVENVIRPFLEAVD